MYVLTKYYLPLPDRSMRLEWRWTVLGNSLRTRLGALCASQWVESCAGLGSIVARTRACWAVSRSAESNQSIGVWSKPTNWENSLQGLLSWEEASLGT